MELITVNCDGRGQLQQVKVSYGRLLTGEVRRLPPIGIARNTVRWLTLVETLCCRSLKKGMKTRHFRSWVAFLWNRLAESAVHCKSVEAFERDLDL